MIVYQRFKEGNWANLISILMGPYAFIVFFNNFYVYKLGFHIISDEVLLMLLLAFVAFFLGSIPFNTISITKKEEDTPLLFENYEMSRIMYFLLFVGVLGILRVIYFVFTGAFSNDFDEMEGVVTGGIVGHLLLASFSLLPIYFIYWTYNKRLLTFIPILLIIIVTFAGFIKYTIIGMFVSIFICLIIYRKSLLKKAAIILVSFVAFVFYMNYAIGFALTDSSVDADFFISHFWKYLAGSVIYDNYIFTLGIETESNLGYKFLTYLCAFPNMFLSVFDVRLYPYEILEMLPVSVFGEDSNVADAIGYLYPSKGALIEIIYFYVFMFILGLVFSYIYKLNMYKTHCFNVFIVNFLCYFVFFSFFGTFYVNSPPWEILVHSLIIPPLFYKRKSDEAVLNLDCC